MQQSAVLLFLGLDDFLQGLFCELRWQVLLTLPAQLLFTFEEGPQYTGSAASSIMYTNKQQDNMVTFNFNRFCSVQSQYTDIFAEVLFIFMNGWLISPSLT